MGLEFHADLDIFLSDLLDPGQQPATLGQVDDADCVRRPVAETGWCGMYGCVGDQGAFSRDVHPFEAGPSTSRAVGPGWELEVATTGALGGHDLALGESCGKGTHLREW